MTREDVALKVLRAFFAAKRVLVTAIVVAIFLCVMVMIVNFITAYGLIGVIGLVAAFLVITAFANFLDDGR